MEGQNNWNGYLEHKQFYHRFYKEVAKKSLTD